MVVHDISVPIRPGMIIYDGNPPVSMERAQSLDAGDGANVSRLTMGTHTGTHLDAPLHFLDQGPGSESIDVARLIGPAVVVDATAVTADFDAAAMESLGIPEGAERVLLKTTNGRLWAGSTFTRDFIRLTGSAAEWVIARGIQVIGIDFLSIGDHDAHVALLSGGVLPLEGVDLRAVEPGAYTLICLPLRLVGSDGAPARAVLVQD